VSANQFVPTRSARGVSSATLAVALAQGDPTAQREVWDRYAPMVRGVLRRIVGMRLEVEDLLQEVFLGLYQSIRALKNPEALKPFLCSIAVRTARHEIRRSRASQRSAYERTESETIGTLRSASASYALIRFRDVLGQVSERERMAFVLRFVEEMETVEIAASLGVSISTARRCFLRAWDRVTLLAERDPFLAEYVKNAQCPPEEPRREPQA
jgi:RNA polymerase sigma factor (sigma-70 family)